MHMIQVVIFDQGIAIEETSVPENQMVSFENHMAQKGYEVRKATEINGERVLTEEAA